MEEIKNEAVTQEDNGAEEIKAFALNKFREQGDFDILPAGVLEQLLDAVIKLDEAYMEEYKHPLWQAYEEFGLRGGHGGMDYLVLRAFVESVQKDECPPIDTYDTASWMAITALTEQSIAMGGAPVPVPDFTEGRWLQKRKSFATGEYALN